MPAVMNMNDGSKQGAETPTSAPSFIGPLSWAMLVVPIGLVVFGILYGLKRWGEESDEPSNLAEGTTHQTYFTGRSGPQGWSGDGDGQGAMELHRLIIGDGEDGSHASREALADAGDADSETTEATAVEGNIRLPQTVTSSSANGAAAGRWKLKREGFSTTDKEFNAARRPAN